MDYLYFGINLRFFRQLCGLTQGELADQAGVPSQSYLSRLERGLRPSGPDQVAELAEVLGVPVAVLLRRPRVVTRVDATRPVLFRAGSESFATEQRP